MGGKLAVSAGLVAGVAAGAALVAGVVLLAPDALLPPVPAPQTAPVPVPSADPGPPATVGPGSAAPLASAAASAPAQAPSPSGEDGEALLGVGQPAPPLVVPQLGGGDIDLAALAGKPVWVNFMATSCPSCRDELPRMSDFQARYADQGLVVLVVDVREEEGAVDAYMRSLGVALPVGLDADGKAHDAWGAQALPVHYWIDADGVVRHGALGTVGRDVMAEGLGTILPGVTVTP